MKQIIKHALAMMCLLAAIFSGAVLGCSIHAEPVYAAKLPVVSGWDKVVCKKNAQVLIPWWYQSYSFSSSNEKVATVNAKGVLTAHRLGVAKITVTDGSEKVTYEVTVVPEKKSDVRLNQEILLTGQKVQLKLVSDKYDTSQVKLHFDSAFEEITGKGWCRGIDTDYSEQGDVTYWYGSFSKDTMIDVYHPEIFFSAMIRNYTQEELPSDAGIDAGTKYTAFTNKGAFFNKKNPTLAWARSKGLEFYLDGKRMPEQVVYTPGQHVLKIVAGKQKYEAKINVGYSVKDTFAKRDATGYSKNAKRVFGAAFAAVEQVVKEGMSDEQKVKAIHDYLIYHADYANNVVDKNAKKWIYGAEGVLLHQEGVCESYAVAFYMMAKIAGLDCHYVAGSVTTTGDDHAWNRVKVDGEWYYIDCTWDDPIGGGAEYYGYYLSKTLWSNHIADRERDLVKDAKSNWVVYYLTGEGYFDD